MGQLKTLEFVTKMIYLSFPSRTRERRKNNIKRRKKKIINEPNPKQNFRTSMIGQVHVDFSARVDF